jgi:hypothetical protein
METICSSETSVDTFQRTARRYIPEDGTLYNRRCENLKSYNMVLFNEVVLSCKATSRIRIANYIFYTCYYCENKLRRQWFFIFFFAISWYRQSSLFRPHIHIPRSSSVSPFFWFTLYNLFRCSFINHSIEMVYPILSMFIVPCFEVISLSDVS